MYTEQADSHAENAQQLPPEFRQWTTHILQKQKIGAEIHIYLEELPGTYHKRLFRGTNTNDMKK
jgi:hypothetical protein